MSRAPWTLIIPLPDIQPPAKRSRGRQAPQSSRTPAQCALPAIRHSVPPRPCTGEVAPPCLQFSGIAVRQAGFVCAGGIVLSPRIPRRGTVRREDTVMYRGTGPHGLCNACMTLLNDRRPRSCCLGRRRREILALPLAGPECGRGGLGIINEGKPQYRKN
jgi:hypothetical protein